MTLAQAQFRYVINEGAITITGYTGFDGNLTIPSTLAGLPVTRIGDNAFQYVYSLSNIVIPNGVISIGTNAFGGCSKLAKISMPNTLLSIGTDAF